MADLATDMAQREESENAPNSPRIDTDGNGTTLDNNPPPNQENRILYTTSHEPAHDAEANNLAQDEKDPFDVDWDGDDDDPLCPRSFNKARKWLIVAIVSHVSLCL